MPKTNAPTTAQSVSQAPDLLELAAEGVVTVLPGAARTLTSADGPGGFGSGRAIDVFGPPILQAWRQAMSQRSPQEQLEAIARLGRLSSGEGRQQVIQALARYEEQIPAEDRALAIEYLSAIPAAVRRCPVGDLGARGSARPTGLVTRTENSLVGLLPTDVPPLPVGSEVAGTSYRLEELLGIGGFGAVYKAVNRFEQNQPPRAIKFCLDPAMVPTLQRERDLLDRLMAVDGQSWSNRIVRLYGYALDVSPPFLVYEFVAGGDLTSHLAARQRQTGRGFAPQQTLEVIRQVVEALAFAHGQGLVHRDLKPANVLVNGNTIKLTDFGIGGVVATHALCGVSVASAGVGMPTAADQARLFRGSGTPLYMSPEQRRGDQPDPRHDLYSLGVLWYQLLIGDVSRELHPGWPDELREEFGAPEAHIQLIQRCVGYFKKRPANARELLVLFGSAQQTLATAGAHAMHRREGQTPAGSVEVSFDHLQMMLADQIDRDHVLAARDTAVALLRLQPEHHDTLEALQFIHRRLKKALREEHVFAAHEGWVRAVAFAPNGSQAVSVGDDGAVRLWDLKSHHECRTLLGHEGAVMGVAFDPHGRWLVSVGWDGTARQWDPTTGRELRCLTGAWQSIKCVAVSPDGHRLLTGSDDKCIHVWDAATGQRLGCLEGHTELVQSLAFWPDSRYVVSGSDDGTVRVWDLAVGQQVHCLQGHEDTVTAVTCAARAALVLSGSSDRTVRLWDVETGVTTGRLTGHHNWVNSVILIPDGRRVLTGSGGEWRGDSFLHGSDTTVRLWDLASGDELCRFADATASVTTLAVSPCGSWMLAGGLDHKVRLIRLPK